MNTSFLDTDSRVKRVTRMTTLDGFTITTTDYSPNTYGSDDTLYKDREFWDALPRGCCKVDINGTIHWLTGLKKFGWESDDFGDYTATGNSEIYLRKENGECFHVRATEVNKTKFWIMGSKNVHFAIRDDFYQADVNSYIEPRYGFAKIMANIFKTYLDRMNTTTKTDLIDYLIQTRFTFCAESCTPDHQHMVAYDGQCMFFFAVTGVSDSLTAVSPNVCEQLFATFELPFVHKMTIVTAENRDAVRKEIELETNSEGAVVYVMQDAKVVRMYKHKNYRYMFDRRLRQLVERRVSNNIIVERMNQLSFKLTDMPNHEHLMKRALAFNGWAQTELSEEMFVHLSDQWISYNARFDKEVDDTQYDIFTQRTMKKRAETDQLQVFVSGFPGSGKSTLARAVAHLLGADHVNQDACGGKAPVFHKKIGELTNGSTKSIVIDKSFHNKKTRADAHDALKKKGRIVWFSFLSGNAAADAAVCIPRITNRGTNHQSLHGNGKLEFEVINGTFVKGFECITNDESSNWEQYVTLPIDETAFNNLNNAIEVLQELNYVPVFTDDQLHAALESSIAFEKSLGKNVIKQRKVTYWALVVTDAKAILENDAIATYLHASPEHKPNDKFHCTMYFVKGAEDQSKYFENEGHEYVVKVTDICYNEKAAALKVNLGNLPFKCHNAQAHITLALATGTKPVYSNELLASEHKVKAIDLDVKCKLVAF